jgi:hypothetical protein
MKVWTATNALGGGLAGRSHHLRIQTARLSRLAKTFQGYPKEKVPMATLYRTVGNSKTAEKEAEINGVPNFPFQDSHNQGRAGTLLGTGTTTTGKDLEPAGCRTEEGK